jgi:hypothetical protein
MNSLFAIAPYKCNGFWVFDDPAVGLRQEPFIAGADTIIDVLTEKLPAAEQGFRLTFAPASFPGYQARFIRDRGEHGGTWYKWPERKMEGWLCPALFKYFAEAPAEIYVQAQAR